MTLQELQDTFPAIILSAQEELDAWVQDANGHDEVLGAGGACGLIADRISEVLSGEGFLTARMDTDFDGGHEFVMALVDEGAFIVDIPASVYESGSGYVWTKKEGVLLTSEDVSLLKVRGPMSESEFSAEFLDEAPSP